MENLDQIKMHIIDQENQILGLQQKINGIQALIMQKNSDLEEQFIEISKNQEEQDSLDLQNKKTIQDNENLLSMFQSYSKFYNDQIKDLENDLISSKIDLANKLTLLDEYKNNIMKLKKKLVIILKNCNLQFELLNFPKVISKKIINKSKSLLQIYQNAPPPKNRCLSFDFKNEKENEIKETKFFYKMSLLQLIHKNSMVSNDKPILIKESTFSQKNIKNETEVHKISELRRKTISVVMNHFKRSPSLLLKSYDSINNVYVEMKKDDDKSFENWEKNILPMIKSKQNREKVITEIQSLLKKSHIPSKLRGIIWPFLIGNKLKITKKLYENLTQELQKNPHPKNIVNLIRDDIVRTYPKLAFSNQINERDFYSELQQILENFQLFRPDIGYIQGMSYIGAIFLFHMGKYKAFKCMSNLIIGDKFLRNLFSFNMQTLEGYLRTFDYFLKEFNMGILKLFEEHNISTEIFLYEWFYSLYARAFHLNTSTKIWDIIFAFGYIIIFKTAFAICSLMENHLISNKFDEAVFYLRYCTDNLQEPELLKKIFDSKLSQEKFENKLQKEAKLILNKKTE